MGQAVVLQFGLSILNLVESNMDMRNQRTVSAGGREWTISEHMLDGHHPEIIEDDVVYVLDNWVVRGIHTSSRGRQSRRYYAFVPRVNLVVRVAVSMDNQEVITAFIDGAATRHWRRGNLAYFSGRLTDMEMNGGTNGDV